MTVSAPAFRGWARFLEDKRRWGWALWGLVLLRLVMWWLFQHDLPRMQIHDGWYFFHGGDQIQYFEMAQSLLAGQPRAATASAGWSFVLAGLLRFAGAHDYTGILPEIVIGNGLLLALISIPVMARFGLVLGGSRTQAWCAAVVWTLLPYVLWLGFLFNRDAAALQNAYVSRQMWVSGITDGSSLLFAVLGVVIAFRPGVRAGRRGTDWLWLAAAGLSLGWGAALRIQVFPAAAAVVAAYVWQRRPAQAAVLLAGCLAGFGPQFWYDTVSTGHPLNLPYFSEWLRFDRQGHLVLQLRNMQANPASLLGNLAAWFRRLPALAIGLALIGAAGLAAFVRAWRRDAAAALVMFGLPALSFGLHAATYIYTIDPVRYTLPAVAFGLPALMWTAASIFEWSDRWLYRRFGKGSETK